MALFRWRGVQNNYQGPLKFPSWKSWRGFRSLQHILWIGEGGMGIAEWRLRIGIWGSANGNFAPFWQDLFFFQKNFFFDFFCTHVMYFFFVDSVLSRQHLIGSIRWNESHKLYLKNSVSVIQLSKKQHRMSVAPKYFGLWIGEWGLGNGDWGEGIGNFSNYVKFPSWKNNLF